MTDAFSAHFMCLRVNKIMALIKYSPIYLYSCHEIMVLFVLRKLILQTRMRSHPVAIDVWFLVGLCCLLPYIMCANSEASGETSLVAYLISTIISWAGSNVGNWRVERPFFAFRVLIPGRLRTVLLFASMSDTLEDSRVNKFLNYIVQTCISEDYICPTNVVFYHTSCVRTVKLLARLRWSPIW